MMRSDDLFQQVNAELERERLSFCATDVQALQTWLQQQATLPLGDRSQAYLMALLELQQLQCDELQRFAYMQAFHAVLQVLIDDVIVVLAQHQYMKFSPRYEQMATLLLLLKGHCIRLYIQIAQGLYRAVGELQFEFRNLWHLHHIKNSCRKAIVYALQQCSRLLYVQHAFYLTIPTGQWKRIHQLYMWSELLGLAKQRVNVQHNGEMQAWTAEQYYMQIHLFAILSHQQLAYDDIVTLYDLSFEWLPLLKLYRAESSQAKYKINTSSDQAAVLNTTHTATTPNEADVYLDCQDLIDELKHQTLFEGNLPINTALKFHLQYLFIHNNERKDERYQYSAKLDAYAHYTSIIRFLLKDELVKQNHYLYQVLRYEVEVLDKSLNGYRLLWKDELPERLSKGTYLLLREQTLAGNDDTLTTAYDDVAQQHTWQSAIVRWVRKQQQHIEMGVEVLARQQWACELYFQQQRQSAILLYKASEQGAAWSVMVSDYDRSMLQQQASIQLGEQRVQLNIVSELLQGDGVAQLACVPNTAQDEAALIALHGLLYRDELTEQEQQLLNAPDVERSK